MLLKHLTNLVWAQTKRGKTSGRAVRTRMCVTLASFGLALGTGCQSPMVDPPADKSATNPSHNPVHELRKYFVGLEEWIVMHKGPDGHYCVREDGRKQNCLELQKEEDAAYFEKYGVMTQALWHVCQKTPHETEVPAGVAYDVDEPPELWSNDKEAVKRAREEYHRRVLAGGQEWLPRLQAMGATWMREELSTMPLILVSAKCDVLRAIARLPGINQVMYSGSGQPVQTGDSGPTNSVTHTSADLIFNDYGEYGAGIKIGIVPASSRMKLFDDHLAFAHSPSITYKLTSTPLCADEHDCDGESGGPDAQYRCMNHRCVSPHETATASVIATGRSDGKFNAADSQLYFFNEGQPTYDGTHNSVACTAAIVDAYDWFTAQSVELVNESYDCLKPYYGAPDFDQAFAHFATLDGYTQDHRARVEGISTFRAAGNDGDVEFGGEGLACPYTSNSICVGGVDGVNRLYCASSWHNPPESDREEPDVMGLAGQSGGCNLSLPDPGVEIASLEDQVLWRYERGTSFATPNVVALAAMFRGACPAGENPMALRAILKAAAYGANPDGMRYSTPNLVDGSGNPIEAKDGAGVLLADGLRAFCDPEGAEGGFSETGVIDLTQGEHAPFPGNCEQCGQVLEQSRALGKLVPRSIEAFDPSDGHQYVVLRRFPDFQGRVRAVFTWNACTDGPTGDAPAPLAVDFDLFLVDEAGERVIYSSQSFQDNTEGFDVELPDRSDYALYVRWPEGATSCGGGTGEPYAFAGRTWP